MEHWDHCNYHTHKDVYWLTWNRRMNFHMKQDNKKASDEMTSNNVQSNWLYKRF